MAAKLRHEPADQVFPHRLLDGQLAEAVQRHAAVLISRAEPGCWPTNATTMPRKGGDFCDQESLPKETPPLARKYFLAYYRRNKAEQLKKERPHA